MLDIEILRIIWWALLGFLIMGFAVYDGFDFGAAILLPIIARNEYERTTVLNTIRPFWEGNQVWIILAAGSLFAAWPYVYAVAFSGTYFLILLLLLTMGISRPVSFKYRSKLPNYHWRRFWDWIVFVGGLMPALILGMLVGNVLIGMPFYFDNTLRAFYTGSFLALFNPFSFWCGVVSVAMFVMHGGLYLAIKTDNPIEERALYWSRVASILLVILFALGGILVAWLIPGYEVLSNINPLADSNPLHKQVVVKIGAWLNNYDLYPPSMIMPVLGLLGALTAFFTAPWGNHRLAFICSSISIIGVIGTVGISMFPFILPSSTVPTSSLLVWDASSSALTLFVMLFAVIIFMPIILLYTYWVYYALKGKVRKDRIEDESEHTIY